MIQKNIHRLIHRPKIYFKPDGYEKDVAHFVHEKEAEKEQKPTQDANKETSRDISSIHETEAVPPPAVLPVQDYNNRKPKYVQTSADREKNTENDVSSIQDIQELPDSTPRSLSMALDSIETPVEQGKMIQQYRPVATCGPLGPGAIPEIQKSHNFSKNGPFWGKNELF
jgi:hypothetical protein